MDKNLKQLKNIVVSTMAENHTPVEKIYLFGSKAAVMPGFRAITTCC